MKNIHYALIAILVGLTGLWMLSGSLLPEPMVFGKIRHEWMQYTGVIGICVMSIAMVLATRPRWLEAPLGGLDKGYRLHKWLGIAGLATAVAHWLWSQVPHWLIDLGLMQRPDRRGPPDSEALGQIGQFFRDLREPAEFLGEWAFYAIAVLIVLALATRVPYRWFAKVHSWLTITYLVLVFHSVVLMDLSDWTQPIGIVTGGLMAAGVISALLVLLKRVGRHSQVDGTIETLHHYPHMRVLETSIRLEPGWKGHKAGQFAFVTFDEKEGAHPFTIGSAWEAGCEKITFYTKALGDYTRLLPERLKEGDKVKIEGPYGCFIFEDQQKRQIWIGGGIGIAPFIARMKQLALEPHDQVIDLFHSTANLDDEALQRLKADAEAANIRLHVLLDSRDGLLSGEKLRMKIPDWDTASVWFCGPAPFGKALAKDLTTHGLASNRFHQELFNLR